MKKLNFKEFSIYAGIDKKVKVRCDMRRNIADLLYTQVHGIEAHNLAFTIFRSEGVIEVTDGELSILKSAIERFGTGSIIDALTDHIAELNSTKEE